MIMLSILGSLVGAVVGTRLKIQAMVPLASIGLPAIALAAILEGWTITAGLLGAAACLVTMQIGFLAGLLVRICMAALGGEASAQFDLQERAAAHPTSPAELKEQENAVTAQAS